MMDLAGFIKYGFPEGQHDQIAFAPFPEIVSGMARYEDFALNSIHVPKNAKNKENARDFLPSSTSPIIFRHSSRRRARFRRAMTARRARIRWLTRRSNP
jgi:hypothetical protein